MSHINLTNPSKLNQSLSKYLTSVNGHLSQMRMCELIDLNYYNYITINTLTIHTKTNTQNNRIDLKPKQHDFQFACGTSFRFLWAHHHQFAAQIYIVVYIISLSFSTWTSSFLVSILFTESIILYYVVKTLDNNAPPSTHWAGLPRQRLHLARIVGLCSLTWGQSACYVHSKWTTVSPSLWIVTNRDHDLMAICGNTIRRTTD